MDAKYSIEILNSVFAAPHRQHEPVRAIHYHYLNEFDDCELSRYLSAASDFH